MLCISGSSPDRPLAERARLFAISPGAEVWALAGAGWDTTVDGEDFRCCQSKARGVVSDALLEELLLWTAEGVPVTSNT